MLICVWCESFICLSNRCCSCGGYRRALGCATPFSFPPRPFVFFDEFLVNTANFTNKMNIVNRWLYLDRFFKKINKCKSNFPVKRTVVSINYYACTSWLYHTLIKVPCSFHLNSINRYTYTEHIK